MSIITLLTDFGLKDGYPGVMKGVIWSIAPQAQIADITHLIQPQNVLEGALALERTVPFFPPGTIHVAVVDPGVGTQRRPIAARLGEHYFVGPDNGLCTALVESCRSSGASMQFVHLNQPQYWLAEVSNVFHGRDIFSPVAAHLANGTPLSALGAFIEDPILIPLPKPQRTERGWLGQVTLVDHFGNLSTNLEPRHLPPTGEVEIQLAGVRIRGLKRTFGDGQPGELVALFDSEGKLSICVVNGNAAARLGVQVGAQVEVTQLHD